MTKSAYMVKEPHRITDVKELAKLPVDTVVLCYETEGASVYSHAYQLSDWGTWLAVGVSGPGRKHTEMTLPATLLTVAMRPI